MFVDIFQQKIGNKCTSYNIFYEWNLSCHSQNYRYNSRYFCGVLCSKQCPGSKHHYKDQEFLPYTTPKQQIRNTYIFLFCYNYFFLVTHLKCLNHSWRFIFVLLTLITKSVNNWTTWPFYDETVKNLLRTWLFYRKHHGYFLIEVDLWRIWQTKKNWSLVWIIMGKSN